MSKQRVAYIDLIKVFAIFAVITLHCDTWHTDFMAAGSWESAVQYCIRMFCEGVPIFMLINGFLMFDRPFDGKKHLQRVLKVMLILLVWSVIMELYLPWILEKPITLRSVLTGVLNTHISSPHTGILWFLQKLVVVYLLFPILKHLYDTNSRLFDYLLLVLLISTFGINLVSLPTAVLNSRLLKAGVFFLNQYAVVLSNNIFIIYFMLGGFLYKRRDTLPRKRYIAIGAAAAVVSCVIGLAISFYRGTTYAASFNYSQIFLLLTVVGLFFACSYIPLKNTVVCRLLASVGDNTMGIYLVHKMVYVTLDNQWDIRTFSLLMRLAVAILVFLLSWGIALLIRKIPKLSFLVKL